MDGLTALTAVITGNPGWVILPEVMLLLLLSLVLLADLFLSEHYPHISAKMTLGGIVFIFGVQSVITLTQINYGQPVFAFGNMVINDSLGNIVKLILYLLTLAVLIYSGRYLQQQKLYKGEYYLLVLFALFGMVTMVSSFNFLLLYIGLELLSLALYAFIGLKRDSVTAGEAALKYFVLGSLASGILLFGISMIYGAAGTLDLLDIFTKTKNLTSYNAVLLLVGIVFLIVGIAFKFGAAPFHMWVPDVYEGAPTSVTMFIGSAPKIAMVVFAYRILVQALGTEFNNWALMLQLIAVASIFLGNIAAVIQTNVKRMLGYSTISHMGFVLLGLSANFLGEDAQSSYLLGFESAMFYALTYVAMALAAFAVLLALSSDKQEAATLDDLSGLNNRHPLLALVMLLAMFSMAGIPPLMGFYAKFYVLNTLVHNHFIALAVFAVLMSLIGAFYYLRVVKVMYFDTAKNSRAAVLDFSPAARVLLGINSLFLLFFGIYPEVIIRLCHTLFAFSRLS